MKDKYEQFDIEHQIIKPTKTDSEQTGTIIWLLGFQTNKKSPVKNISKSYGMLKPGQSRITKK